MIKRFTTILTVAFVAFAVIATSFVGSASAQKGKTKTKKKSEKKADKKTATNNPNMYHPPISEKEISNYTDHPKRHLIIETTQGKITLQLFDKIAPKHVQNIVDLANSHFYDGTTFHRVIPGFMIQGGDPNSKDDNYGNDGTGSGPNMLPAEFNATHHAKGILSMARASDPNSASCQFFICVADAGFLDRQYTVFGQVLDGMDIADKIVELKDVTGRPQAQIAQGGANPGKTAEIKKMYITGK